LARASTRAALVYLHGTHDRQRVIAAVGDLASKGARPVRGSIRQRHGGGIGHVTSTRA
jgi:hypothetical protein